MDKTDKETNEGEAQEETVLKVAPEPTPEERIAQLQDELEQSKKETLYLRAEFDNFRKNSIKERSNLIKYGPERFIVKLLEVIDNFDRALEIKPTTDNLKSFAEGFKMTSIQFDQLLEEFGVKKVNPLNEDFDPKIHEALSSEPSDTVSPGKILKVYKPAYTFHDKTIRTAQVVVSKESDS